MTDSWDKFVDGAKDFAGTVAGAAGELYGKSKEYFSVKRLEYQLREKYRLLGKLQYKIEIKDDVDTDEKENLVKHITALREEIKNRNGKEQNFEYIICKNCEAAIPSDAKFCPGCGMQL